MKIDNIKLDIIFDNKQCNNTKESLWGFACLIETPNNTILFDTGSNGRVLLKNIKSRELSISNIDTIFISHSHWDHIGGIDSILELNKNINIFLTSSLSKNLIRDLKTLCNKVEIIGENPIEILPNIYSTGAMSNEKEQALIIDTNKGLIIIAGCSHSGIDNIAIRAKEFLNKKIFLLLGGFHLYKKSEKEIIKVINTIEKVDTQFIAPSHCTGDRAIELFQNRFKENYINSGMGIHIDFQQNHINNYCF
jgi:7,8-dihydropterin-6-yl-methyl-4-(beta-D-ribofuranosyl)aminobenzene 5'-phosphate synthase